MRCGLWVWHLAAWGGILHTALGFRQPPEVKKPKLQSLEQSEHAFLRTADGQCAEEKHKPAELLRLNSDFLLD